MGKPNILFIVLDAVRADHTTPYGYQRNTTPNIDRIADEGVVFTNAFTNSNWTLASHGAIFTGQLPSQSGVLRSSRELPSDTKTLSEHVKDQGYRTFSTSAGAHLKDEHGFSRGFDTYKETYRISLNGKAIGKIVTDSSFRKQVSFSLTNGPCKKTLYKFDSLKRWIADGSDDPFFAFLNCKTAHSPYNPPRPYKEMFCDRLSRPRYEFFERLYSRLGWDAQRVNRLDEYRLETMSRSYPLVGGEFRPTKEEWDVIMSWYDGAIRYLDYRIGELLDFLDEERELDNTFIVITSDHGELFGEYGLEKHVYSLYEPLLRVPLVIRPSSNTPGVETDRVDAMVSLMDLFPTIIEAAGGNPPDREYAESLYELRDKLYHEYVFAEVDSKWNAAPKRRYPDLDDSGLGKPRQAVRDQEYKLVRTIDGDIELYDWQNDPEESEDLSEANPVRVSKLQAVLRESAGALSDYRGEGEDDIADKRLRKQLENLGYL